MSEFIETLKLEFESLKSDNKNLIDKNKNVYNRNKNLKRSNLRLRNLVEKLRPKNGLYKNNEINEINTNDWDIICEE
jgi:FtsZ-binding cell division protein ZapB